MSCLFIFKYWTMGNKTRPEWMNSRMNYVLLTGAWPCQKLHCLSCMGVANLFPDEAQECTKLPQESEWEQLVSVWKTLPIVASCSLLITTWDCTHRDLLSRQAPSHYTVPYKHSAVLVYSKVQLYQSIKQSCSQLFYTFVCVSVLTSFLAASSSKIHTPFAGFSTRLGKIWTGEQRLGCKGSSRKLSRVLSATYTL